jgi:MFS family permease
MSSSAKQIQCRVAVSACFGTFLEWYDFLTFASLATYFSVLFFPAENPVAALLASLATFAVGMIVRPLGAAVFGSFGDRFGRRPAFVTTIALMGLTTFLVGLLPTYEQIGIAAPLLLLFLRVLQGLAVGGEIGGAAVYLTEHAPENRRGLYTSVLQLMGPLGIMASTLQIVLLNQFLTDQEFRSWGWRVPFILSILLLAISLKSRVNLHESPIYQNLRDQHGLSDAPLRECWRDKSTLARMLILFFCISSGGSLLFFSSQVYTGVFLKTVVKVEADLADGLGLVATLALFPLTLLAGWLSDRYGRRTVLLSGLLIGALALQPAFYALRHFGNPGLQAFNDKVMVKLHGSVCAYDPFFNAQNDCERAQEWLSKQGVSYQLIAANELRIHIGEQQLTGFDANALRHALAGQGFPFHASGEQINSPMIVGALLALVVALALITGPQTATLAEFFPARFRYSAVALPHNLAAGWIGGLSPFMVTLLGVKGGDVMAGLWYPNAMLILAFVVGMVFLPETRNRPLEQ